MLTPASGSEYGGNEGQNGDTTSDPLFAYRIIYKIGYSMQRVFFDIFWSIVVFPENIQCLCLDLGNVPQTQNN